MASTTSHGGQAETPAKSSTPPPARAGNVTLSRIFSTRPAMLRQEAVAGSSAERLPAEVDAERSGAPLGRPVEP